MYEVLWLKQLSHLFGNTAYASSATLGAFFLGLAAGCYWWGKRSAITANSLRLYAFLELGIALSALLFFLIFKLYFLFYSPLFIQFGHNFFLFTAIKFLLSLLLLFVPCFFMGGTIPVIANAFIGQQGDLGKKASFLYAVNTLGAVLGAFVTGFALILLIGIRSTYTIAVIINIAVSGYAWAYSKKYCFVPSKQTSVSKTNQPEKSQLPLLGKKEITGIAFFSGFLALCLEILWIRMFALVLHNSVYSFSAVLIVFIFALALGSVVANRLCQITVSSTLVLSVLFILTAACVGLSPAVFNLLTNHLSYTAPDAGWLGYILTVFRNAVIVILVPGIIVGTVFPYLFKISQSTFNLNSGNIIGNLSCVNTIGAAIGAMVAGFFFLQVVGLWRSFLLISGVYCVLAVIVSILLGKKRIYLLSSSVLIMILLLTVFNPQKYSIIKIDIGEELLEKWEGSHGSVAVVKGGENLSLVLDNYYTLGDLSDYTYERMQAHLPLILHGDPKDVFFLGMGTGITAGASLVHPVSKVTTCELVPEVITAAKKYFGLYTYNLFTDNRSQVIAEDGRNFLLGTKEHYDVIISDLFTPWGAGTGSLYTIEHYQSVYSHLNKNGVFAQWLPLYQLSKREFDIIAKSMLEVFPQVTLWRGDLFAKEVIVALVGHESAIALDPDAMIKQMKSVPLYKNESNDFAAALPLIFYGGNISENWELFKDAPVNTDNRPLIEYLSPITHRNQKAKKTSWYDSYELLALYEELLNQTPPEDDSFLAQVSNEGVEAVKAGLYYVKGTVLEEDNKIFEAEQCYKAFFDCFSPEVASQLEDKGFQFIGE